MPKKSKPTAEPTTDPQLAAEPIADSTPVAKATKKTDKAATPTEVTEAAITEPAPTATAKAKSKAASAIKKPKLILTNLERRHGKKWRQAAAKVDRTKLYPVSEALSLVKETASTNFDGTVELHAKLGSTTLRGMATLPHGTGRDKRVVIFSPDTADELIEKVTAGWTDFDIAIATPAVMPRLAKLAKVLGPKGLMPSPKAGTVSDHPDKVAEELKGGRIEYRADKSGALHQAIGKVSWEVTKLTENLEALLHALPTSQVKTLWLTSTMGPSIRLEKPAARR